MGLLSFLSPFRRMGNVEATRQEAPEPPMHPYGVDRGESFAVNRFDSSRNSCLEPTDWRYAQGQSINADLQTYLRTMQAHCQWLYHRNPYFRGVVRTLRLHVVGKDGPRLQIRSGNKTFNEIVERAFKQVFAMPDPAGRLAGVASLGVDVTQIANAGSSLAVAKNVRRDGPVKFGYQTIHPRRLMTPSGMSGDPNVALGIRFDDDGRPLTYYLDQPRGPADIFHKNTGTNIKPVPAESVRHIFLDEEGEQITGVPLMASCLETADQLVEYDRDVMEAAKLCAKETSFLEAADPASVIDPDPIPADATEIELGRRNVTPLGWKNVLPTPTHPMAQYADFRHERLAELGRPLHMPLMLVLLSSRESNFSSAQFDGMIYAQGVSELQSELTRQKLLWVVENIVVELVLSKTVARPRGGYTAEFTWDVPPHANIDKVAKALRSLMEDGLLAPEDASAFLGYDYEQVVARRKRNADQLADAELPPAPVNHGSGKPADEDADDEDTPANEQDEKKRAHVVAVTVPEPLGGAYAASV